MGDTYYVLGNNGYLPGVEAYPKAREAALKALELDESLAEAHASLAAARAEYDRDWSAGEREYQRAIGLNPNYDDAMVYLNLLNRRKADVISTASERASYVQQADELLDKVKEIK